MKLNDKQRDGWMFLGMAGGTLGISQSININSKLFGMPLGWIAFVANIVATIALLIIGLRLCFSKK